MKRFVRSSRNVWYNVESGFSFCEPPPCRFGRMYSRPSVSRSRMLTIAGTRVSLKNACPPSSWFKPSCVLRVYDVRNPKFQSVPMP